MGEENEACKSNPEPDASSSSEESEVILNVYDLTPVNQYSVWFGFGVFHSGIEGSVNVHLKQHAHDACLYIWINASLPLVHGKEYGFGAHDFPISGVFEVEPKSCPGFIYRCSVPLGHLDMPPSEFRTFIEGVASEYHGNTYHLISKNCNHFTDDISKRLLRKGIPGWVNRLARLGAFCSCLLPESLQVSTVKQLPEYHAAYTEDDGSGSSSSATPHEPTESEDGDQDKLLLPSLGGDVAFIKEFPR
ncbi:deSI-like protein At4g17486 isoform X1 [Olea europaea var. sylvestris]|uniref:deSI-like protein At4g17486 isoform X1 n=1 Tax=Olea europaea var. sylvestris TaxID=158386 RepID=UPI000C1D3089|nr:deSI-like protein At4g17486 isoform X1 [Olea europaea var. sylvestris]